MKNVLKKYFGTDPVLCLAEIMLLAADCLPLIRFFLGEIFKFALIKSVVFSISKVSVSLTMSVSSPSVGIERTSSFWVSFPRFGLKAEVLWAGRNSAESSSSNLVGFIPPNSGKFDWEVISKARFSFGTSVFLTTLLILLVLLLRCLLLVLLRFCFCFSVFIFNLGELAVRCNPDFLSCEEYLEKFDCLLTPAWNLFDIWLEPDLTDPPPADGEMINQSKHNFMMNVNYIPVNLFMEDLLRDLWVIFASASLGMETISSRMELILFLRSSMVTSLKQL